MISLAQQAVLALFRALCSRPCVPRADRPRPSCCNQGGRSPKRRQVAGFFQRHGRMDALTEDKRGDKRCLLDPSWGQSGQLQTHILRDIIIGIPDLC